MAVWNLQRQLLLPFLLYLYATEAGDPVVTSGGVVLSTTGKTAVPPGPATSMLETAFFSINPIFMKPNVVFSPYSIAEALEAAAEGAAGECFRDLTAFLYNYAPKTPLANLPVLSALTGTSAQAAEESAFFVDRLTAIVVDKCYGDRDAFEKYTRRVAATHPNARVQTADFHNPQVAARELNEMVENVTRGKIRNLLSAEKLAHHRVVLVNAIYLNAKWRSRFSKWRTHQRPFYSYTNSGLAPTNTSFMQQTLRAGTFVHSVQQVGDDTVVVLGLPYGDGESHLFFYMPDEVSRFDEKLRTNVDILSSIAEKAVLENDNATPIDLSLPKFHFLAEENRQSGWSLMGTLGLQSCMQVGMGAFEGIGGDESLFIPGFEHAVDFGADEEGTEAAAATAATFADGAEPEPATKVLVLERPFYLQLMTRNPIGDSLGVVLFAGRVASFSV